MTKYRCKNCKKTQRSLPQIDNEMLVEKFVATMQFALDELYREQLSISIRRGIMAARQKSNKLS